MSKVVPTAWHYEFFQHTMEGPDDMTGHLKCSMLGCAATIPVQDGKPLVPVVLTEHRDAGGWGGGHSRSLQVDFLPAAGKPEELQVREGAEMSVALKGELINLASPAGTRG